MKKHVIFLEARGGTDKGPDGHRPDTMPMIRSLQTRGWTADVIFYSDEEKNALYQTILTTADAYISRINPGNLENESEYFEMLRTLSQQGVIGMAHPDAMINYGAKDALVKLRDTHLVPIDTYAYYTVEDFKEQFPKSLASGERVLKQNRGSTGEGIWRVQLLDNHSISEDSVALDAKIKCTEAKDNHTEIHRLDEFIEFCTQYIIGENGMLIDMRFLPRIKEGEIRILMIHDKPVHVVHKKPAEGTDNFSATLFSGAKYRYDSPDEWKLLVESFLSSLPTITEKLGGFDLPLIWTADFILDHDQDGNDTYILGEMNCSCVGFTSQLSVSETVADEIIKIISAKKAMI